jgi:N-acetylmuramoyl-L-alanine amidase
VIFRHEERTMKFCIDPGHGMSNSQWGIFDPGAVHIENGFKFQEAAIALRYGLALKDAMRSRQAHVFMTRDDDNDHAPVGTRAKMAKDAGCDMFISVHLNDVEDDNANGLEVLYGKRENEGLAEVTRDRLCKVTGIRPRRNQLRDDLAVLKFAGPALLIELGFIGNDNDRGRLLTNQVREAVAHEICNIVFAGQ